jgi:hypothetical protein
MGCLYRSGCAPRRDVGAPTLGEMRAQGGDQGRGRSPVGSPGWTGPAGGCCRERCGKREWREHRLAPRPQFSVAVLPPQHRQQRPRGPVATCRGAGLPRPHDALLDDTKPVRTAPVPAAKSVCSGKGFDLGSARNVGHKTGPVIAARTTSDGPHRRLAALVRYKTRDYAVPVAHCHREGLDPGLCGGGRDRLRWRGHRVPSALLRPPG